MNLTSNSRSAYCHKYDKPVIITESSNSTQGREISFDNLLKCSDGDKKCEECTASGWSYDGERKQYWELD